MKRKRHKFINGVELKCCNKCNFWLSLDSFTKSSVRFDGLLSTCKECDQKQKEKWRSLKPKKICQNKEKMDRSK